MMRRSRLAITAMCLVALRAQDTLAVQARVPQMSWLGILLSFACVLGRQGLSDTEVWTAYGSTRLDAAVERWWGTRGNRRAPAVSVAVGFNGRGERPAERGEPSPHVRGCGTCWPFHLLRDGLVHRTLTRLGLVQPLGVRPRVYFLEYDCAPDGAWISVSLLTNADNVSGLNELASDIVRTVMHQSMAASAER